MTIPSIVAAKAVCERSSWNVSNLALQKILYVAHMIYAGRTDGKLMVSEPFEAWDYGPVLPSVYHRAKAFGSGPVRNVFHGVPAIDDDQINQVLNYCVDQLAHVPPGRLVDYTHHRDGAWAKNYAHGEHNKAIPIQDIVNEYRMRFGN